MAALIPTPSRRDAEIASTALGWLTLALAAVELAAPGRLSRSLGLSANHQFLKGFGAREMATGAGLFGWRRGRGRSLWIWARVAGDAMDIATIAPALGRDNPKRKAAIAAFAVVVGVTLVDVLCARALDDRD
ncbi:hypothetical protein JOD31_002461 [Methylopila capsulata]|uniref:Cyclase dehydrase n=1 Tax=Methylopila capsulata TaxID=61654 RepID=A0A9W6MS55_9HYPH|nr:hypothetical protein [Methylopila capsulata]MBM7852219.1 hypothetical protein [Methylopila capsulata]GLK56425.1 hypothetical protein GCM10008170_24440 [Methylopila capsulata]